ncbi:MAG: DUF262 domain-containing protein [Gammaproteobacteria bacterium]|nr:DUF262 domain-containing protein [Gammaproteobacteria bacterium]
MLEPESTHKSPKEDIEGYDSSGNGQAGYPLDSLFIRQETRSVSEVLKRVKQNRWILDPDFQRDFVWDKKKQSKLIESCIMRIPLPVFYVAEREEGEIVIVDGLQRITTFLRYVDNEFKIQGTSFKEERNKKSLIEGQYFHELSLNLQERILDTQLIMYILDANAPERARLDIFERVNSGVALSRQQMRNAVYNGPATRWLKEIVESRLFHVATGRALNTKVMRDREAVNRFCAFSVFGVKAYRGDMDEFLARTLRYMNDPDNAGSLDNLRKKFERSLQSNKQLFGKHAFRKSLVFDGPGFRRSTFNISLFDVCTVVLAKFTEEIQRESASGREIRKALIDLIEYDERFKNAITLSTNSTKSVKARFTLAEEAFGVGS